MSSKKKNKEFTNLKFEKYVSKDSVIQYLSSFFTSFAGYNFISISRPGLGQEDEQFKNAVEIVAHKTIPIMDDDGRYHSEKDVGIKIMIIDNYDFPGIVVDKESNYFIGNIFKQTAKVELPELMSVQSTAMVKQMVDNGNASTI